LGNTMPRRGPYPGRAWDMYGHPGPHPTPPFRVYHPHENLISGGSLQNYSAAATRRQPPEREKLFGR
jgi:hypothetical protein